MYTSKSRWLVTTSSNEVPHPIRPFDRKSLLEYPLTSYTPIVSNHFSLLPETSLWTHKPPIQFSNHSIYLYMQCLGIASVHNGNSRDEWEFPLGPEPEGAEFTFESPHEHPNHSISLVILGLF